MKIIANVAKNGNFSAARENLSTSLKMRMTLDATNSSNVSATNMGPPNSRITSWKRAEICSLKQAYEVFTARKRRHLVRAL